MTRAITAHCSDKRYSTVLLDFYVMDLSGDNLPTPIPFNRPAFPARAAHWPTFSFLNPAVCANITLTDWYIVPEHGPSYHEFRISAG
jgi:hypothetical protein